MLRHGRGFLGVVLILVVFGMLVFLLRNRLVRKHDASPPPVVVAQQPAAGTAAFNPEQIIPGRQIGPVTLGMTQDEVVKALGLPTKKLNKLWEWRKPQMSVAWGLDAKVVAIMAGGAGATAESIPLRTSEGIMIGTPAEQVISAWGDPESDRTTPGASGVSRQMNYDSRGVQLLFYDGRLIWLLVRQPRAAAATKPAS